MSKSMDLNFFKSNLLSGISVAALSMPIGIAYAEMVGLPPEAGVYTVIFGLIGYFVLGTSRELIIGPDSAIVALLASSVIALSGDGSEMNLHFIALITITTGILFFVAGKLKLGFIANFLSKPILIGFLNGIAGILIISQLQKFTGVIVEDSNSIFGLVEFFSNLTMLHFPTLITGISAIIIIKILEKSSSKIPAQFTLIVFSIIATVVFNLEQLGVLLSPEITSPVPTLTIPDISLISGNFSEIFFCSLAILFISYTNQILTARSFSGNKNEVDPNREFYAVGLSDVLCGLFNGYPVCGSGSRTAVNIRSGSNSKLSGILAAGFMLFVILFFSKQFSFIPSAVIGAIIIDAGIGIFNFKEMNVIRKFSKEEYYISLICMAGVLINGVLYGILLSILLSFLMLIKKSSVPEEYEMVFDKKEKILVKRNKENDYMVRKDVLIYRFNSALLFYNCNYFRENLINRVSGRQDIKIVLIDSSSVNYTDITGLNELIDIIRELKEKNVSVSFMFANLDLENKIKSRLKKEKMTYDVFSQNYEQVIEFINMKK